MRSPRLAALAAVLPLLAGCTDLKTTDCSVPATNRAILADARSWYLFDTLIPAGLDPAASPTSQALLDAITAGALAQGKDRHFSFLTTQAQVTSFFQEGTTLGYGVGVKVVGGAQLLVTQVFAGSPAALAGLGRGDEVLAIAPTAAGLDAPASQLAAILAADAATPGALGAAFSSGVPGTTRFFRLKKAAGATVEAHATTVVYSLDPVPNASAPIVLTTAGGKKVGYLSLRTFVGTADPLLRQAVAALQAQGVSDLVVDLRYNGGGSVDIASLFLDLVHAGHAGELKYRFKLNAQHTAEASTDSFKNAPGAVAPARVAFIVTGGSASASELMVNALLPDLGPSLAIVGDRTFGKPVGQLPFDDPGCPTLLYLISFQLLNRSGTGDYFQGLPDADFTAAGASACAAADDLSHATGDPAEASTAAALQWIDAGTCPAGAIPPPAAARQDRRLAFPEPAEPTLAQRHVAGLF